MPPTRNRKLQLLDTIRNQPQKLSQVRSALGKTWHRQSAEAIAHAIGSDLAPRTQKSSKIVGSQKRAKSTTQKHGFAKTFAAENAAQHLEGDKISAKHRILRAVNRDLRTAEKKAGRKLTPQEKRVVAAKALSTTVKEIKSGKKEVKSKRGGNLQKPQATDTKLEKQKQRHIELETYRAKGLNAYLSPIDGSGNIDHTRNVYGTPVEGHEERAYKGKRHTVKVRIDHLPDGHYQYKEAGGASFNKSRYGWITIKDGEIIDEPTKKPIQGPIKKPSPVTEEKQALKEREMALKKLMSQQQAIASGQVAPTEDRLIGVDKSKEKLSSSQAQLKSVTGRSQQQAKPLDIHSAKTASEYEAYAKQELAEAKKSGDKTRIEAWEKEAKAARKRNLKQSISKSKRQQTSLFDPLAFSSDTPLLRGLY